MIAIPGSHGKTTTTKMFATSFDEFGINFLIGDGTGKGTKDNKYFALEACEWKRHFLEYNPNYVYYGEYSEQSGYDAGEFFAGSDVTAVICSSDLMIFKMYCISCSMWIIYYTFYPIQHLL